MANSSDACFTDSLSPQERLVACTEVIQDLSTSRSGIAYSWLRRGYALRELGKPGQAVAEFDQAIGLYPNYAEAHLGRGLALTDVNRLNDAELALTTSIAINPDLAEAYNNRGIVRGHLSKLEQAIEDYTQAIRLKSSFSNAFNNRGTAYYEQSFFDRAVIDFNEALRISPKRGDILYNRAVSYAALGKDQKAVREFNTILKIYPGYARAYFNRGELRERLGDLEAAKRDWKKALEIEPDLPVPPSVRKAVRRSDTNTSKPAQKPKRQIIKPAEQEAANQTPADKPVAIKPEIIAAAPAVSKTLGETAAETVALPKPVQAAAIKDAIKSRNKVALIIGNGKYKYVPRLKNPTSDAQAIADSLGNNGFDVHDLVLDNGRNGMIESLKSFSVAARNAEVALIYFAGHGLEVDGNNYMIPVDAKLAHQTDLAFEAVELEQIVAVVEEASELGVVILDACRDNPFINSMQLNSSTRSLARGLKPVEPRRGVLVAYAAKHGTVALDALDGRQRHSPYTQALLDHLPTDDLDISLMFRRVSDQVWDTTGGRQLPYIYGSLPGNVVALVNSKESS